MFRRSADDRISRLTVGLTLGLALAIPGAQTAAAAPGGGAEKASHGKPHAKSSKRQLRELREALEAQQAALQAQNSELQALRSQLATLQGQSGSPATPTGAAGGDLTGTYPNPTITMNALGSAEVTDGSLLPADFNPLNVDGAAGVPSLRTLGMGASQALPGNASAPPNGAAGGDLTGTYPNPGIGAGQVRASELGTAIVRTSAVTTATDGMNTTLDFSCNAGERLLSGGTELIGLGAAATDVEILDDVPIDASTWRTEIANNFMGSAGNFDFRIRVLCLQA